MPVLGLAKGAKLLADEIHVTAEKDRTKIVGKVIAARVPEDGVLELDLDVEDLGFYRVTGEFVSLLEEEPSKPDA